MAETALSARTGIIEKLRQTLAARGLDAFILPRFDAHQGEYVAPHDERLAHVTGFTGSAGMAIIAPGEVAIFVDGRYSVQLGNQCPGADFSHYHLLDAPPERWLTQNAQRGWRIGYDPMHLPPSWYDRFYVACDLRGAEMVPTSTNPVDEIWDDQPAPPLGIVTPFPPEFAGRTAADKCAALAQQLSATGLDLFVETQIDNIAWLLNVRGDDIAFNPMPQSFLIATKSGKISWFVDPRKLDDALRGTLPDCVSAHPMEALLPVLGAQVTDGMTVGFDPDFSAVAIRQTVEAGGGTAKSLPSPITRSKAVKNAVELAGLRDCHLQDGVAWTEFTAWLMTSVPQRAASGDPVTEQEAQDYILSLRKTRPGFLTASFQSISAAGGNAAMCHYAATGNRNAPILPESPYLLDSGGQYETGTTDATRSFAFGPRPDGYDRAYTAVFKALYTMSTLRFPKGTQGHHIDAICRRPLWDLGLDYDHGTGHGIGHRLSVHEHPQRLGRPYNPVDLVPGMVVSIEPGYYEAWLYGIRIENIVEIVELDDGFLGFRNMTYAPIQTDMLIPEQMTEAERAWLDSYHDTLRRTLGDLLSANAKAWLDKLPDCA